MYPNGFRPCSDWLLGVLALLMPATQAGAQVDTTPLPIEARPAFTDLNWSGWSPISAKGRQVPLRPIMLTHAGDGSDRLFVATQLGVVHVFPNDEKAKQTKVFLDVRRRVVYKSNQNEEGLLGLAFHPDYKKNGQFFLYYTTTDAPHTSVISRFRVSEDDPDRADAKFDEEILRIKQPFWNHNGGTLAFGPDGYLYIALGDGGAANDPHRNGQNLKTLHGSILRIDVNRKQDGKNYAIPRDNPFVGRDDARGEIWAYGLRNVWRMSFDRETGDLWAGDVGQDLWEEINVIVRGGNYGWNLREARHKFRDGSGPRKDLIEPIWEYHHRVGKSITGGHVYRGKKLPELAGLYLYADYVSGHLWALRYDAEREKVTANHTIRRGDKFPVMSFGEDQAGEAYFLIDTKTGRGIYRLARTKNAGG